MRTTLDIDEQVLRDVVEVTGELNKSRAANKALKAYLRAEAVKELIALAGRVDVLDDRDERDRLELQRQQRQDGIGKRHMASNS